MLKNWINIFIYQIKNNKLFTALNVLGLSIGISGLIFALLYWNDEQSYDAWNPEKENVYQVLAQLSDMPVTTNNPVRLKPHLESDPNVETVVYADEWYQKSKVMYNGQKEFVDKIINAERGFFTLFPFEIIYGNATSALKDENGIAISEKLSQRFFGNQNPVGKQIKCFDTILTIGAVYRIPGNSSIAPNIVVNRMKNLADPAQNPGLFVLKLLVKLKDPSKADLTRKMLEKVFYDEIIVRSAKQAGFTPAEMVKKIGNFKVYMEPLSKARLHSITDGYPEGRGNYQFLMIMAGLSVLILVLSIVNYINLATANAIKRAKEVGVRKILGASKRDIVNQFIFETVLITLFSILLALVIVEVVLPYYNSFLGKNLRIIEAQFYIQLIIVFIVTIIVSGIFPALYVANFETLKVLKGNYERSKSGVWLRNGMLIFQFAIATFFIIGSSIVYEQVNYLNNKNLGFKGNQVLAISLNLPSSYYQGENAAKNIFDRYETIKQELKKIKGVEKVSTGLLSFDGTDHSFWPIWYHGVLFKQKAIGLDYAMLDLLDIKIIKGRNFDPKFASDTINSVLLNEKSLQLMNIKDPIGKEIKIGNQSMNIIGIVKDFNLLSPEVEVPPITFYHIKTLGMAPEINRIYIKLKSDNIQNSITDIEKFWKTKVDTEYPFKYDFVDKEYARTYESYVKQKNLFLLLNIVVILIALFGLFALASYSIQRRMKEIAIRKTLGAETNVLLKELSKQYILYCIIGFLIALFPIYFLLNKWLQNFAFRIDITITPFLSGFILLLFLTLIIVLARAYQATKTDILKYLKYE
ncbi:putative ABC transport system permease protein [Flavobacterium resistens]|uniref:FtsX-like permease family protein n=1 Tax=Flavobacterium resistens TaxID=443612 RepID=A0A521EVR0_9FLAO|nr:ABC transporter permease [Flavobacterium resistens]MRX68075.1 FtsX-like permease family protein [Flavobacterium resistens]SMO87999.1 putative ABC transport system permease protein [Flavobacterium resistens]